MSDLPDDTAETPIQRALRLKQAAASARPGPPRGGKFQRQQAASVATGKSKPWMKRKGKPAGPGFGGEKVRRNVSSVAVLPIPGTGALYLATGTHMEFVCVSLPAWSAPLSVARCRLENGQLSGERSLVRRPRFATGDVAGEVRVLIQNSRTAQPDQH